MVRLSNLVGRLKIVQTRLKPVTHPSTASTKQAQCRLTKLTETNVLPLHHTVTHNRVTTFPNCQQQLANMQFRLSKLITVLSSRVSSLVGLGLPFTVTIRVSRVSVRVSVN